MKVKSLMSRLRQGFGESKGFTLVEILIVIMIMGVLISVIVVNFAEARRKARDGRRKADLRQLQSALEMYKADYSTRTQPTYPYLRYGAAGPVGPSTNPPGYQFLAELQTYGYVSSLPKDPSSPDYSKYYYIYRSLDGVTYLLCAYLENASDPDITANCGGFNIRCGPCADNSCMCNYTLTQP